MIHCFWKIAGGILSFEAKCIAITCFVVVVVVFFFFFLFVCLF